MKLKLLTLFVIATSLIASCKKDSNDEENTKSNCGVTQYTMQYELPMILTYDSKGLLISGTDDFANKVSYNYNANNQLVSSYFENNGLYYIDSFIYNSNNKLINYTSYSSNSSFSTKTFVYGEVLSYNSNGQLIMERDSAIYSDGITSIYKYTYKDNSSNITKTENYEYDPQLKKSQLVSMWTTEYTTHINNLITDLYKLPSYILYEFNYEFLNTELLPSKDHVIEYNEDGSVYDEYDYPYSYTFDSNNKVKSITEDEELIVDDIMYNCD